MNLSPAEARRIILHSQHLSAGHPVRDKKGLLNVIENLGYVQIDTLSVIARAHHHTLWSRMQNYEESMLHQLLAKKKIFEYWGHAASYLPISEYPYSLLRKKLYASGKVHWFREDNPKMKKLVLDRIRSEGPLQSKDFEHIRKQTGAWYEWKPAKRALEQLFMEGKLMVSERRNFQKVYDLAERVYPEGDGMKLPSEKEYCEHLLFQNVKSNGLVLASEVSYLKSYAREGVSKAIKRLLKSGMLEEISVEGIGTYYGSAESIVQSVSAPFHEERVHLLTPFDNVVIQRKRLQTLFGFDFIIECYVPQAKRKFGYYCLPVLFGDKFVARFDPKADRSSGIFYIQNWHPEKGWKMNAGFATGFAEKVKALAKFSGCDKVHCAKGVPGEIKAALDGL